jgi:SAM-dependent methyltransferase
MKVDSFDNIFSEAKYFDWFRNKTLSEVDGIRYEEWHSQANSHSFAVHPNGFLIFLSPAELRECDEYSDGDPYEVHRSLNNEFHQRRIQSTLHLLSSGIGESNERPKILDNAIKERYPDARISGLDYSFSAINFAVRNFSGIDFCLASAYTPPYSKEYFDIVVCNNLWEHVPDPLRLLERINVILKEKGHLIISTPSRYRLSNLLNVLRGRSVVHISPRHVPEYQVGPVIEQLKWGGFKNKEIYSKTICPPPPSKTKLVFVNIVSLIIKTYLMTIKSHHSLESTVFFLAQKSNESK